MEKGKKLEETQWSESDDEPLVNKMDESKKRCVECFEIYGTRKKSGLRGKKNKLEVLNTAAPLLIPCGISPNSAGESQIFICYIYIFLEITFISAFQQNSKQYLCSHLF